MSSDERVRDAGHVSIARLTPGKARVELQGRVLGLNERGARIESDEPLPLESGDLVHLDIALETGPLDVEGRIVRVRPSEVGVEFVGLALGDKAKLRRHMADHRSRSDPGA